MSTEEPKKFREPHYKPSLDRIELVPDGSDESHQAKQPLSPEKQETKPFPHQLPSENQSTPSSEDQVDHPVEIEDLIAINCPSVPDLDTVLSALRESLLGFSKSNIDTNRKSHLNADPAAKFGGESLLHFGSVVIFLVLLLSIGIAIFAPQHGLSGSRAFNLFIVVIPVFAIFAHSYTTQLAGYSALKGHHKFAELFYNLSNGIFRNSLYITIRQFADTAEGAAADYYMRTGRLRKADAHIDQLLKVTTTPGKDLKALAKLTLVSTMKASVAAELGKTEDARVWIEESLNWFERTSSIDENDRKLIASESLHNIASALRMGGAPKLSLDCYLQSMAEATGETRSTTVLLRTILGAGLAYLELGQIDSASKCFQLLDDVISTYQNIDDETILQLRIAAATLDLKLGKLDEAEAVLTGESERLARQGPNLRSAQYYTTRADVYQRTGRLADAISDLEIALDIFRHNVSVASPHFKSHLALYDACLTKLVQTQPDLAHEKRSRCIELLQIHESAWNSSITNSRGKSSIESLRKSVNIGSYHFGFRQKLVFGGLIFIGLLAPTFGGIRAADFFDWSIFSFGIAIAALLAHNIWTPRLKQILLAKKFKGFEIQHCNVAFKRVEQSEWTNAQVFTAHIGAPYNQEYVVSDHMDILSGKLFKYARPKAYTIVTTGGVPQAVLTDDGYIPLADVNTPVKDIVARTNLRRRVYSYGLVCALVGGFFGFSIIGMNQFASKDFHSKLPANLSAYEYYRFGAKILTDEGDSTHPERLATGEKALQKAQELDPNGLVGTAASKYRESHVLAHTPDKLVLQGYKTAKAKFENNPAEAVTGMENCIKQDPQFLLPYVALADYYTQKHQLEDALKALKTAESISSKDSRYLMARGRYEAALNHHEAVKKIAKQLLENDPLDPRDAAQVLFF